MVDVKKQRKIVRGKIPPNVVGYLWMRQSGADDLMKKNEGVYESLCSRRCDPADEEKIIKDVARTFADSNYSKDVETNLFSVLKAYSCFDPSLGCKRPLFCFAPLF